MDCGPLGSSVHAPGKDTGVEKPFAFPRDLPNPVIHFENWDSQNVFEGMVMDP